MLKGIFKTPKGAIQSGRNSILSKILCLSSLPANWKKIKSKLKVLVWRHCFPQNFRHSRVSSSEVNGPIWPEIELIRDFMPVLITSKFEEDLIKNERDCLETPFSDYKSMGNFLDAQGHLTPNGVVQSGRNYTRPRFYACPCYLQV